jgi:hypothetical protein
LADLLRRAGLKATVYKGTFRTDLPADEDGPENGGDALHFWVLCEGFLVDITADQFNDELDDEEMPGVYCEPAKTALWRYGKGKDVRGNLTPKILDHDFKGRKRMGDIRVNETMDELRKFAGALSVGVPLGKPMIAGGTRP